MIKIRESLENMMLVVTIVFIILKLCGVIHWSWIFVLAPMWIPVGIGALIVGILWTFEILEESKNE